MLDPVSYSLAKKAKKAADDAYSLASKHANRHVADGADPITGFISPEYIGPYSDTASYLYFRTLNKDGSAIKDHIFAPSNASHGYLGYSTKRWLGIYAVNGDFSGGVTVGARLVAAGLTTTDDVYFYGQSPPTTEGSLRYDGLAYRLKFHDGTAARTIAWLDVDVLGGLDPNSLTAYLATGKALALYGEGETCFALCFPDAYADLAVQCVESNSSSGPHFACAGRVQSQAAGMYTNEIFIGATTADHRLLIVSTAKSVTILGSEAVDLNSFCPYTLKLRCSGSTIESYRSGATTPQISVTDTTFALGYWGVGYYYTGYTVYVAGKEISILTAKKASASMPPPKPIAFFEVPVEGDGTLENPFRPSMPNELFEFETPNKRLFNSLKAKGFSEEEIFKLYGLTADFVGNRLALSYGALIPTNKATGKPIHGTALIRVFPQPDRGLNLHPISKCLDALRVMKGVSELKPEDAKRFAKSLDDRLREGELEFMVNPTEENELHSLADFYEREVVDEKRVKPEEVQDFDKTLEAYMEKSEKIGRKDLAERFRAVKRKS
jgi:hypothetical protein